MIRHQRWSDGGMNRLIDVFHIELCRLDLETLNDTRVRPTRRASPVRGREQRSDYPANHPKPETLSRFSANERPALFSSAHQLASQDPSVIQLRCSLLPFNASKLSNALRAVWPSSVVLKGGRRQRVLNDITYTPAYCCYSLTVWCQSVYQHIYSKFLYTVDSVLG